jgi:hypothetical protein
MDNTPRTPESIIRSVLLGCNVAAPKTTQEQIMVALKSEGWEIRRRRGE